MEETWILNPKTGRPVRIKGDTYNRLVNQGVIENKHIDKDLVYTMKPGDNHKNIMYQLRKTTPVNQNQVLRLKDGQVRRVYKGGPKPQERKPRERRDKRSGTRSNQDRLRDTQEWTNSKAFKYFASPHNHRGQPVYTTECNTDNEPVLMAIDAEMAPNINAETPHTIDTDVTETDNIFED